MNIGILGLGLIGGSFARAYAKAGHKVFASEKSQDMLEFAKIAGAVQGELDHTTIPLCDLIIMCIYPDDCAAWLESNAAFIKSTALVMDACGTKKDVCDACFPIANRYGFTFVGGHPMAGSHNSGFKYSRSNLFQGAPMVLVPPKYDDMELLQWIKDCLEPCKFGMFSVTTAEKHDIMIAFTSQMPHILSNAYIKSPTAITHKGFSAGSYKDLTRVAWLNPQMWAELFMNNKPNILNELDFYMSSLQKYKEAIKNDDKQTLIELLEEGKLRKEQVDG